MHRKHLAGSFRLTDTFAENLELIAGTFEGGHRTKVHAAGPLGADQLHTEHVCSHSGAVTSSYALTLLECTALLPFVTFVEITRLLN